MPRPAASNSTRMAPQRLDSVRAFASACRHDPTTVLVAPPVLAPYAVEKYPARFARARERGDLAVVQATIRDRHDRARGGNRIPRCFRPKSWPGRVSCPAAFLRATRQRSGFTRPPPTPVGRPWSNARPKETDPHKQSMPMAGESKRVLITSVTFPPTQSGTCVILYELLRHLPQHEMVAVHGPDESPFQDGPRLEVEASELRVLGNRRWTLSCIRRWPELYIWLARRRIRHLARKHRVQRIYAHFPTSCFIVAAWQVAEELRLPLTVYYDILWEETGIHPHLAQKYEKRILRARRQPLRHYRVCRRAPGEEARRENRPSPARH